MHLENLNRFADIIADRMGFSEGRRGSLRRAVFFAERGYRQTVKEWAEMQLDDMSPEFERDLDDAIDAAIEGAR